MPEEADQVFTIKNGEESWRGGTLRERAESYWSAKKGELDEELRVASET